LWVDIINKLCDTFEHDSFRVCASCGKYMNHEQIVIGGWVYDQCRTCLEKDEPGLVEEIKEIFEMRDQVKAIGVNIVRALCKDVKYTELAKGIEKLTGEPVNLEDAKD